jgi:hypothetical protein
MEPGAHDRNLRTAEGLDEEYRQVCRTWNKKPLPDF